MEHKFSGWATRLKHLLPGSKAPGAATLAPRDQGADSASLAEHPWARHGQHPHPAPSTQAPGRHPVPGAGAEAGAPRPSRSEQQAYIAEHRAKAQFEESVFIMAAMLQEARPAQQSTPAPEPAAAPARSEGMPETSASLGRLARLLENRPRPAAAAAPTTRGHGHGAGPWPQGLHHANGQPLSCTSVTEDMCLLAVCSRSSWQALTQTGSTAKAGINNLLVSKPPEAAAGGSASEVCALTGPGPSASSRAAGSGRVSIKIASFSDPQVSFHASEQDVLPCSTFAVGEHAPKEAAPP